jgi:methionyl-tRNA formyltransferase
MSKALRIIYAGTPEFSAAALDALLLRPPELDASVEVQVIAVYTQPDRPAGRGRKLQASPVKQLAIEHDIPVFQPESLRDAAAQQALRELQADLMIVTAYGLILPAEVLQAPRLGCINIHASLLPRWRGAAPIQRAILAGDRTTGITIMQMDEGLDTGDMLAVAECEISDTDTGASLHDKLMVLGADTLLQVLPAIASQTVTPRPQDDAQACYAAKLSKAEARIDWQQPAVQIDRAVRAYNSWPVAYCMYARDVDRDIDTADKLSQLKIWQARVVDGAAVNGNPGTVIAETAEGIDVLTGDGVLRIIELQAEGKRRMSVADFLNANSLLGQRLR